MYYTYIYYDPSRNNEPIYVGKGKCNRAWAHLKSSKKHPFINRLKLMSHNNIIPIIGIYAGLDEDFALLLEVELISKFGRKDLGKGSLLNLTDGGEGISGKTHSQLTRVLIAQANTGKIVSEETKKKMSISGKGNKKPKFTDKHCENISKSKKGTPAWNKGIKAPGIGGVKKGNVPWNKGICGPEQTSEYKIAQSVRMTAWWELRKELKND